MLYIVDTRGREIIWHVGKPLPVIHDILSNIVSVQADGDELEHVRDTISGIPDRKDARVVSWFGDHARFIAGNL